VAQYFLRLLFKLQLGNLFKIFKASSNRLIVYGDVHGCLDEFKELRQKIAPKLNDIEVSLGDIINKGPYSKELVEYFIEHKIHAVIGNHEDKILRYYRFKKLKKENHSIVLSESQQKVYNTFGPAHFEYFSNMPLFYKFGKVTLLHAGITNAMRLEILSKKESRLIFHIRWLDKEFHFVSIEETKNKGKYFWSDVYDGSSGFIVYGHQPFKEVKVNANALGIDTGCSYGNKLTAAVFDLDHDEVQNLNYTIYQVNALAVYSQKDQWI